MISKGRYIARPIRTPRPLTGCRPRASPIIAPATYLSRGASPRLNPSKIPLSASPCGALRPVVASGPKPPPSPQRSARIPIATGTPIQPITASCWREYERDEDRFEIRHHIGALTDPDAHSDAEDDGECTVTSDRKNMSVTPISDIPESGLISVIPVACATTSPASTNQRVPISAIRALDPSRDLRR